MASKDDNMNYVDNEHFYNLMLQRRSLVKSFWDGKGFLTNKMWRSFGEQVRVSEEIGRTILDISTNLSYRRNFINYSFREELIGDGVENCLVYIDNFDPVTTRILTWGANGSLRVWDARNGEPTAPVMWHDGAINGASFSPCKMEILSWCEDGTVHLHGPGGTSLAVLKHNAPIVNATFIGGCDKIVTWNNRGESQTWEKNPKWVPEAFATATPPQPKHAVNEVYNSDGTRMIIWDGEDVIRAYSVETRQPTTISMEHGSEISGILYGEPQQRNPFAYFTQTCFYAFVRRITKETKQWEGKKKMIERVGVDWEAYARNDFDAGIEFFQVETPDQ